MCTITETENKRLEVIPACNGQEAQKTLSQDDESSTNWKEKKRRDNILTD